MSELPLEEQYHVPVMLQECLDGLSLKSTGVYVDCTLGGGGHFRAIGSRLTGGTVIGVDRDPEAIAWNKRWVETKGNSSMVTMEGRFSDFPRMLDSLNISHIDGILMDLGVSSHQIDDGARGFAYKDLEAPLDMRMDCTQETTAAVLINTLPTDEIARILSRYGEVKNASRMAQAITAYRKDAYIATTSDLIDCLEKEYKTPPKYKVLAKVYQALRIVVNDELGELERALVRAVERLNKGGRIVIMSYHSLEDRIVKQFFLEQEKNCICPPSQPFCSCNVVPTLKRITRKARVATELEINENSRARSAKLRIAERV